MMRKRDRYPRLNAPLAGWQIQINPEDLIPFLEERIKLLESEVKDPQPINIIRKSYDTPEQVIESLHSQRFPQFQMAEKRQELERCIELRRKASISKSIQLNQKDIIETQLNISALLRRVADELDLYFNT